MQTTVKYNRFSTRIMIGDAVKGVWKGIPYSGKVRGYGDEPGQYGSGSGAFKFYVNLDTPIAFNGDVRDGIIVRQHSSINYNQTIEAA